MKKAFLTAIIAFAILNFGYLLGYNAGKYHQRKGEFKIDLPEEPIGLGATIRKPDTLLAYQLTGEDTVRIVYYDRNRILGECDSTNYPF